MTLVILRHGARHSLIKTKIFSRNNDPASKFTAKGWSQLKIAAILPSVATYSAKAAMAE